jgi:hypothetical protein
MAGGVGVSRLAREGRGAPGTQGAGLDLGPGPARSRDWLAWGRGQSQDSGLVSVDHESGLPPRYMWSPELSAPIAAELEGGDGEADAQAAAIVLRASMATPFMHRSWLAP